MKTPLYTMSESKTKHPSNWKGMAKSEGDGKITFTLENFGQLKSQKFNTQSFYVLMFLFTYT